MVAVTTRQPHACCATCAAHRHAACSMQHAGRSASPPVACTAQGEARHHQAHVQQQYSTIAVQDKACAPLTMLRSLYCPVQAGPAVQFAAWYSSTAPASPCSLARSPTHQPHTPHTTHHTPHTTHHTPHTTHQPHTPAPHTSPTHQPHTPAPHTRPLYGLYRDPCMANAGLNGHGCIT